MIVIGEKLSVITKQSHSDDVHMMSMDKSDYIRRKKNGLRVFENEVFTTTTSSSSQSSYRFSQFHLFYHDECVTAILHEHQQSYQQYTIIIIELKNEISIRLRKNKKYLNLISELSEIYFFYLHPSMLPIHRYSLVMI
jgi:hypothetical protein